MRGFIVLCFSAVALAAPQGYNYNAAAGQQGGGFGGNFGGGNFGGGNFGGGLGHTAAVGPSHGSSAFQHGGQSGQQGFFNQGVNQGGAVGQQQQAIISKRFYIHSAPEDSDDDFKEKHITVGVPRKNYNVVFIRAPAKSNRKSAIKISPAVNEEKTVIYVLSKKTDSSDLQAEVIETTAPTSKPEVFFIKYKTAEEAAHAQEQIQQQYDALGGSSQVTDEGVAPVTSVIGSLGESGAADGAGAGIGGGGGGVGGSFAGGHASAGGIGSHGVSSAHANNAYLPPHFH